VPFLYAFDGKRWRFVTDALGRSPAGLLYDGVHQAAADTREWLVVRGRDLAPSDGQLLLDFTEELWETVYFDLAQLRAVDHPTGSRSSRTRGWCRPVSREAALHGESAPKCRGRRTGTDGPHLRDLAGGAASISAASSRHATRGSSRRTISSWSCRARGAPAA
jgi:hypothetical protein